MFYVTFDTRVDNEYNLHLLYSRRLPSLQIRDDDIVDGIPEIVISGDYVRGSRHHIIALTIEGDLLIIDNDNPTGLVVRSGIDYLIAVDNAIITIDYDGTMLMDHPANMFYEEHRREESTVVASNVTSISDSNGKLWWLSKDNVDTLFEIDCEEINYDDNSEDGIELPDIHSRQMFVRPVELRRQFLIDEGNNVIDMHNMKLVLANVNHHINDIIKVIVSVLPTDNMEYIDIPSIRTIDDDGILRVYNENTGKLIDTMNLNALRFVDKFYIETDDGTYITIDDEDDLIGHRGAPEYDLLHYPYNRPNYVRSSGSILDDD